ncbi:nucleoside-diphosphate-sugar epimerase [Hymenobacter luteus]|uniref:Nucleoside-diphosphate-sugar epimerase n=2 Tax=Hymenobacter TaxID=89966 RepID=A0A7W9T0L2_9BACT|nr:MULTISPECIES: NmrA family NAD(P)-binding protein [Hymenobacter]MBB4601159.1 nucleoside-diphosphate-sugar epimerase [Hymenobacter latericoloratus]MBB6058634.1 nucleoside-diphosphate-sugar epimerase [Hymenobacter luteus]
MTTPDLTFSSASAAAPARIVLAGATGALGLLIAHHLRQRGAAVRALVRPQTQDSAEAASLRLQGVELVAVDYSQADQLRQACEGAACVVSALSGLREVIVEGQTRLLEAAVAADVPRFIPSDFSIDYTKLPEGSNRNLDLRREFQRRLDQAPIRATSILNGMFTDLLTGQAPVILMGLRRVVYWGDADQPLDFTTMRNTAAFTAAAALDATAPRYLRVAGEVASIRGLQAAAQAVTGREFKLLRVGSLAAFGNVIKLTKALMTAPKEVFPPWQGMQYLHNMFSGRPKLEPLDNARYPDIRWTPVREVLAASQA